MKLRCELCGKEIFNKQAHSLYCDGCAHMSKDATQMMILPRQKFKRRYKGYKLKIKVEVVKR